jgi:hypothetical protein
VFKNLAKIFFQVRKIFKWEEKIFNGENSDVKSGKKNTKRKITFNKTGASVV